MQRIFYLFTLVLASLQHANADNYALLIGVAKYPPDRFTPLPGAENDVRELAAVLRGNEFREANVVVMSNRQGAEDPRYLPLAANIR